MANPKPCTSNYCWSAGRDHHMKELRRLHEDKERLTSALQGFTEYFLVSVARGEQPKRPAPLRTYELLLCDVAYKAMRKKRRARK